MFNFIKSSLKTWANSIRTRSRLTENFNNYANQYIDTELLELEKYFSSDPTNRIESLENARKISVELTTTNPHAKNILNHIINYTVGSGFAVTFKASALDKRWKKIKKQIRWYRRSREIVRRIMRHGEAIIRKFNDGEIRFVEPSDLTLDDENNNICKGIETNGRDYETIVAYHINVGDEVQRVDASEIFHFFDPESDLTSLRGWPIFADASNIIRSYQSWVNNRALLNRFRSTILMIRKHKMSTVANIRTFQDRIKSGTITDPKDGAEQKYKYFNPGQVLDANDNINYEFISPNIGSQDVVEDGRALRLLIACFFSFPEFMVTADASNSNFASTAVAEAPGIKALLSWQDYFKAMLEEFIFWLDEHFDEEPTIRFPSPTVKKESEQANARSIRFQNRTLSRRTWIEMEGLDADDELERVQKDIDDGMIPEIKQDNKLRSTGGASDDSSNRSADNSTGDA